ncbi:MULTISPECIES: hypothetical protein [Providencia]|uniref:hypothetical protein n=1 Tax=Providencia TaxID=586 RepID=UPI001E5BAA07|nr:hypothetical protein [Providencia sp. PROV147]UFK95920.1 hypothetical protein LMY39_07025 [Providencia rettgeri]
MSERDWFDWVVMGASVLSSFSVLSAIVIYMVTSRKEKNKEKEERDKMNVSIVRIINLIAEPLIKEFDLFTSREPLIEKNSDDVTFKKNENMYTIIIQKDGYKERTSIFIPDLSLLRQCAIESSKSDSYIYESVYKINTYISHILNSTNFIFRDESSKLANKNYFNLIKERVDSLKKEMISLNEYINK